METILSYIPSPINRRNFRLNTVNFGYPWLTLGAILEMERFLTPEFKVLELGSGGSTIFFSKRCKSVKSYDHNPSWISYVKTKLPDPSNVTFVCGSIDETEDLLKKEPSDYDLILVDSGPTDTERKRAFDIVISKVKVNGYLMLDNYNDPLFRNYNFRGWKVFTYDQFKYGGKGTKICVKR